MRLETTQLAHIHPLVLTCACAELLATVFTLMLCRHGIRSL
jgi:hypothetical protein